MDDFSTSSLLKEKGDNLTSERLSKLSLEEMVNTLLAKAGVVSFTRVMRVMQDALIVQGSSPADLQKEEVLTHLFDGKVLVLPQSQSVVADS